MSRSTAPTTSKTTLPDESTNISTSDTIDPLLTEIANYFIERGFQSSLISHFLKRWSRLEFLTNEEIMFDFIDERERLDPIIYIGIEGSEGVESGKDKELLVKWGLTEESAGNLRNSVHNDTIWTQQVLKSWIFKWIYKPYNSTAFNNIFYNENIPRNVWISYERKGGPQLFASSYEDIINIGMNTLLISHTKVTNIVQANYKAFFHATDYQSAQSISKNGIEVRRGRIDLDFGRNASFYLNPSLENAIDFIKDRVGFNAIVVYWADMERVRSTMYQDLVQDEELWKETVVASRCDQLSAVDINKFVYGYQLANPRQILNAWQAFYRKNDEHSWRSLIHKAKWFDPVHHLQLAIKTDDAAQLMNSYYIGTIYFHTVD